MDAIKDRVKALRLGLVMTQSELARRCDVSQPSIANIERGRTTEMKGYLLERLARELNTTATYILTGAKSEDDHESSMLQAELVAIFAKLPPEDQQALIRSARGMYQAASRQGSQINPFPKVPHPAN
jgi:transcriptional regulator with XRE-family HTH domain